MEYVRTRLDKLKIEKLTDRLLSERHNNLKRILDIDHRLETVSTQDGVEWMNDSKATTIGATKYSLQCMESPVIWMMSCEMRYEDLSALRRLAESKVKALIYVGAEDSDLVEEFVNLVPVVVHCESLTEAVAESRLLAESGDVVLFSPASPTANSYENYRARGEAFRKAVT